MSTREEPTNADLYERLGSMEATFNSQLVDILNQVKKTNGRVTRLERWKERFDIIAEYKKENGEIKGESAVDWQKIVFYTLGLVGTALAAIIALAK